MGFRFRFPSRKKEESLGANVHVIVGLGNPGSKYADTRHNAGAKVVQRLAKSAAWKAKFDCGYAKGRLVGKEVLFVLPQSFMNNSGEALSALLRYFKVEPESLIIVHDEVDLSLGTLRLKKGGGSGGHRGVEDIISYLDTTDFLRVRVGVGHPRELAPDSASDIDVSNWVLGEPRGEEKERFEAAIEESAAATKMLLAKGLTMAQRHFHRKEPAPEQDK